MSKTENLKVSGGLNDEHLKALGAVTCNTSWLDGLVEGLIWILSDFRSDFYTPGPILTDRMGEQQRKRVLNSLAKHISHVDPELSKRISAFISKVGRFQKRRNELIHATWNYTEHPVNAYYSIKENTPLGPVWKDKETSVKELKELANRAYTLSDECLELLTASRSAHVLRRRRALRTKS